jgi:hypothetical protein
VVRPLPGSRRSRSVWTAPARAGAVCQAWVDLSAGEGRLAAAPSIGKAVPQGTARHTLREPPHKAQEGAPAYGLRWPEPALSAGSGEYPNAVTDWLAAALSTGKAVPRGTALHTLREFQHEFLAVASRASSPRPKRPPKLFTKPWRKRPRNSASLRWNVVGCGQGASHLPPALL